MKYMLLSATALALILSVPAYAAHHDRGNGSDQTTPAAATADTGGHGHGGGHGGGAHGSGGANPLVGSATGGAGSGRHRGGSGGGATTNNIITGGGTMGGTRHRGGNNGGNGSGGATANSPFVNANGLDHTRRGHRDNSGVLGGRNNGTAIFGVGGHGRHVHNNAFDTLRRVFNAPHHYRHGSYHRPHGWYAHRWNYGEFLPALFYGRNYWIDDYSDFDLSDPPPGTVWVRYGDDALLIDEDTGEVIQVVYGIFY